MQDSQVPPQPFMQHTPSAQNPDAHSVAAAQVAPSDFLHAPLPSQVNPGEQSPETVQAVPH